MKGPEEITSRGAREISDIAKKVRGLHEWHGRERRFECAITLSAKEFDIVKRWPETSRSCGLQVTPAGIKFEGREIRRAQGVERYPAPKGGSAHA